MTSNKLLVTVAFLASFSLVSCEEKKKEENKATEATPAPAAPGEAPATPAEAPK